MSAVAAAPVEGGGGRSIEQPDLCVKSFDSPWWFPMRDGFRGRAACAFLCFYVFPAWEISRKVSASVERNIKGTQLPFAEKNGRCVAFIAKLVY
jgi:hypothetical protein